MQEQLKRGCSQITKVLNFPTREIIRKRDIIYAPNHRNLVIVGGGQSGSVVTKMADKVAGFPVRETLMITPGTYVDCKE